MTILVTGGAGFIGSHVVLDLVGRGEDVVVLDNLSTGLAALVPRGVPLVVGDAGDVETVARVLSTHGVRTIMHFAARIIVPESVADPLGYYLSNTVKTRALLAAAVQGGVGNFVFSSTAAVYGDVPPEPVPETRAPSPLSPYGMSKWMSEMMLRDVGLAHGLSWAVLRYFNVAGADPEGRSGHCTRSATHLLKVAIQAALGQRPYMEVFGTDFPTPDGTGVRDYIHVTDLAAAHHAALASLRGGAGDLTLNVGYGCGYSVLQVVDAVKRASGVDFEVRFSPRRAGDPASVVARVDRIRAGLGWTPKHASLDRIVADALRWERLVAAPGQVRGAAFGG
jgi:UDP-glucose 4-epimerase